MKCSVRANEQGEGYFFAGTYEKGLEYKDFNDVSVDFEIGEHKITMPSIDIKAGTMFFYPFNMKIGSVHFDYILTQPIAKTTENGETVCYFAECEGIAPKYSVNGEEKDLDFDENGTLIDDVRIIVISYEKAKKFHFINGKPYFADGTVYSDKVRYMPSRKQALILRTAFCSADVKRKNCRIIIFFIQRAGAVIMN